MIIWKYAWCFWFFRKKRIKFVNAVYDDEVYSIASRLVYPCITNYKYTHQRNNGEVVSIRSTLAYTFHYNTGRDSIRGGARASLRIEYALRSRTACTRREKRSRRNTVRSARRATLYPSKSCRGNNTYYDVPCAALLLLRCTCCARPVEWGL
jgi:hypothetical protein